MIVWLINFLKGYLEIAAQSFFPERFINLCMRNNIFLWDIRRGDKNTMHMKVSIKGFKKMRVPARQTKTRVRIKERHGLPLFLNRYRRRKAFAAGLLIFVGALILLCSFIWSVEIVGCKKISENEIRNALNSCGIRVGVIKYNKSSSEIKEELLRRVPGLSWAWVEIRGTCAVVEVKEKTPEPEVTDLDAPCNIVAAADGVISDYIVKRGVPTVKRGDGVTAGTLLVSGVVPHKTGGVSFVHSEAEVYARVWYEKSGIFPLSKTEDIPDGTKTRRYTLSAFGWDIPLYFGEYNPYNRSSETGWEKRLHLWGDFYLPLSLKCGQLEGLTPITTPLSADEAREYYGQKLFDEIRATLPSDARDIKAEYLAEPCGDGIKVTCSVECTRQIGEYKKISIGETN